MEVDRAPPQSASLFIISFILTLQPFLVVRRTFLHSKERKRGLWCAVHWGPFSRPHEMESERGGDSNGGVQNKIDQCSALTAL